MRVFYFIVIIVIFVSTSRGTVGFLHGRIFAAHRLLWPICRSLPPSLKTRTRARCSCSQRPGAAIGMLTTMPPPFDWSRDPSSFSAVVKRATASAHGVKMWARVGCTVRCSAFGAVLRPLISFGSVCNERELACLVGSQGDRQPRCFRW